jgi:hypothetical protein
VGRVPENARHDGSDVELPLLSIDDLFAAGIGLDVAGAYLLGRGLLASPATITRRATPRWDFSAPVAVGLANDRVDAMAGISVLLAGFGVQAVAYTLLVALDLDAGQGWSRAATLLGCAAAAAASTIAADRSTHWLRLRRVLIELARYGRGETRHDEPSARLLQDLGQEVGFYSLADEVIPGGPDRYAARVFGVARTRLNEDAGTG